MGISEEEITRIEMVSLLCMGEKTHSMLNENMPKKSGTPDVPVDLFDKILSETAKYCEPRLDCASGNMTQGQYFPKSLIWQEHYNPIHVLLRSNDRRDFQASIERFNNL